MQYNADGQVYGRYRYQTLTRHFNATKNDILVILSDTETVPETLKKQIIYESSADRLNKMVRLATKAESIEDFKKNFEKCD